jgi:phosphoenolpyruvate carboxykinase (ATP)
MINAALDGQLDGVPYAEEPVFGLAIPNHVPGVPDEVLQPRSTWADPAAYDAQLAKLAKMFADNFKQYAGEVSPEVCAAGPRMLERV